MAVSIYELSLQDAEVLPARETLSSVDTDINAFNTAVAWPYDGDAAAQAHQTIVVLASNED
jgi:hypothetical protein